MSAKCSDCGEPLKNGEIYCPKCGSGNKTVEIVLNIPSPMLGMKMKSAEKDARGKPIKEERRMVKGNTQTKITIDRSKRLNGKPETDVFHEVIKNGKIIHAHLEPKRERKHRELREGN